MIKFSSKAAGDVHMLDEHANQLLDAIGKSRGARGTISADEIPGVLGALQAAVTRDAPQHARPEDTDDPDERERRAQDVDLGRRAYPLIDMLKRAQQKNTDVSWGI